MAQTSLLTDVERRAVDAYKRARLSLNATAVSEVPSNASAVDSVLFATDATIRRSLDRVLLKEAHLNHLKADRLEEEANDMMQQCVLLEIKRERCTILLHRYLARKQSSLRELRSLVLEIRSQLQELRGESLTQQTIHSLRNSILHGEEGQIADEMVHQRARFAVSALPVAHQLPDVAAGVLNNVVVSGEESQRGTNVVTTASEFNTLEERRRELCRRIEAVLASSETAASHQWVTWNRWASETACLHRRLEVDRGSHPDVAALRRQLADETASQQAQQEERQRQYVAAKEALENAHRDVFQLRKQLVSVHRRLTEWAQTSASSSSPVTPRIRSNAQQLLQRLKNELALGKSDLLYELCAPGSLERSVGMEDSPRDEPSVAAQRPTVGTIPAVSNPASFTRPTSVRSGTPPTTASGRREATMTASIAGTFPVHERL